MRENNTPIYTRALIHKIQIKALVQKNYSIRMNLMLFFQSENFEQVLRFCNEY